ncbi:hypothetical protein Emed_005194 [Eimeria media]
METPQGAPQGKREAEKPSSQQALDHAEPGPQEETLPLAADLGGPEQATEQQQEDEQEEDEEQQEEGEEQQGWPKRQQQHPLQQQQVRQQQQQPQQQQQQGRQQQVLPDAAQRQPSIGEVEALTQQLVLLQKLIEEGRGTSDMQQLLAAASAAAAPLPLCAGKSSTSSAADGVRLAQPCCLPALLDGVRAPPGSLVSLDGIPHQQQQQQALVAQEAAPHLQPVGSCAVRGASLSSAVPPLVVQGPDTMRPLGRQSHNSTWRPPTGAPPGLGGSPFEGGVSYPGAPSYRAPLLSTSSNRSFSFGGRGAVTPQGRGPMLHQPNFHLGTPNGLRSPLQVEDGVFGSAFAPTLGGAPREQGSLISVGAPLIGPPSLLHLGPPHSAAGALSGHPEDPRALGVGPPPPSLDSLEALLSRQQQQQQQRRGPRGMGGPGPHGAQSVVLRRSPPRAKSVYFFCPSCLESFPASSLSLFAAHVSQKGHVVQQLQRLRGPDGYYRCPKCTCKGSDLLGLLRHWQEGGAAHHGQKILKHIRAREPPVKPAQPVAVPSIPRLQQQNQLALLHQQQQQHQQQMLLLQDAGVVGGHSLQGRCRRRGTREGDPEVSPPQYPLYPLGPHQLRPQGAPQSEEGPSISHRGGSFPPHIGQDGWTGPPLLRDVRGGPPSQPSVSPLGVDFHSGSISQKSSGLSDEASDESLLQTQQQQEQQEQLQQQREEALRCLMGLRLSGSGPGETRGGVTGAGGLRSNSPLAEETMKAVPFRRGFRGPPTPPLFGPRLELPEGPRPAAGQGLPSSFDEGASGGSEDGRVAPARGPPVKGMWGLPQQHSHEQQRDLMESQPLQHQRQQQLGASSVPANFLGNRGVPSALQQPAADRSNGPPPSLESLFVWASPSEPRRGS